MGQIIHFKCRRCEIEIETPVGKIEGLQCPECGQPSHLRGTARMRAGGQVEVCAGCGHDNLYIQKDFNRTLGIAIVGVGVTVSMVFFALDEPLLATAALVAMAAIDALIYALVGSVTVCYTCHTIYRGFPVNPEHEPFSLELLERHGGKDPRH